jgi:hypothetical protein
MMSEMSVPPEALWNSQQESLVEGKAPIPEPLLKEGQVNGVMRNRVAIPQNPQTDRPDRRPG